MLVYRANKSESHCSDVRGRGSVHRKKRRFVAFGVMVLLSSVYGYCCEFGSFVVKKLYASVSISSGVIGSYGNIE